MEHQDPTSTLTEPSDSESGLGEPALVHIGSPERAFQHAGRVIPLDEVELVRFGRLSGSDLDVRVDGEVAHVGVPVPWVSSAHAELSLRRAKEGVYQLRDLGSRNGTHVGGRRVETPRRLRPGEIIEIGRTFWMLRVVPNAKRPGPRAEFEGLTPSANPTLNNTYQQLARVARSNLSILLHGETGTGKRRTGLAIHKHSGREGPFVAVNLAAISDENLDDALEGDGGLFERAAGGTLFFDELAELSDAAQTKLLAALDRHQIGQSNEVRVIASTLVPLSGPRTLRRFRTDLLARLAGFEAYLPPLRDRREDLGLLVATLSDASRKVATPAFRRILAYRWPFNLRELRQTLATAKLLAGDDGEITAALLADLLARRADAPSDAESIRTLREQIIRTLVMHGGSTDLAAEALKLTPTDLHRWIERFDIQPEDFAGPKARA